MISEIGIVTERGVPVVIPLHPPSQKVTMLSPLKENVKCYLGTWGLGTPLPEGFTVKRNALVKMPWAFGRKFLLPVNHMSIQQTDGHLYNYQFALQSALVTKGIRWNDNWYCYVVVESSKDPRYRLFPLTEMLT